MNVVQLLDIFSAYTKPNKITFLQWKKLCEMTMSRFFMEMIQKCDAVILSQSSSSSSTSDRSNEIGDTAYQQDLDIAVLYTSRVQEKSIKQQENAYSANQHDLDISNPSTIA